MTRAVNIVKIFLASPSDLNPEREIVADVIASLNAAWTKSRSLRLELVRWETDVAPGAGIHAQDVVNRQIGDDYDIFLGLFWKTIGSPTRNASSGSIEEFKRAHERFLRRGAPSIMIYFKMAAPASLDDIDPLQVTAVRRFRTELSQLGVLFRPFETTKQFEDTLRINLVQVVEEVSKTTAETVVEAAETPAMKEIAELGDEADEGFLDLVLRGTESFERVSEASKHLTARIGHFSTRMVHATEAISQLGPLTNPGAIRDAKRVIDTSADDLDAFAAEIEAYTPVFSATYSQALESYTGAAVLSQDFKSGDKKELAAARQIVGTLKETLARTVDMVKGFRETIEAWPRASTRLNRAKRRAKAALDNLHSSAIVAVDLSSEAEAMINALLGQRGDNGP